MTSLYLKTDNFWFLLMLRTFAVKVCKEKKAWKRILISPQDSYKGYKVTRLQGYKVTRVTRWKIKHI